MHRTFFTDTPEETIELGKRLGARLQGCEVLAMVGDLAAGKTTFTRGIAIGLGLPDEVHSPTFTLIHEHTGDRNLYHVDLYRLDSDGEIDSLGLEEYLYGDGVVVLEWADKMAAELPPDALHINISSDLSGARKIDFQTDSPSLKKLLEEL